MLVFHLHSIGKSNIVHIIQFNMQKVKRGTDWGLTFNILQTAEGWNPKPELKPYQACGSSLFSSHTKELWVQGQATNDTQRLKIKCVLVITYGAFFISTLSLILYFCSCFCECCQCLSNWEVQTWQMAPCHNHWDSAVLQKLVSLRFMHSTLRYSPKHKGHPKAFLPLILKLLWCFTIML